MLTDLLFSLCVTLSGVTNCSDEGTPGSPYVPPDKSEQLAFVISGVSIASPPVVDFTVVNENGETVLLTQEDIESGALRFGIAKLVPGENGDADNWQSYINTVEVATPDVGPDGSAALESAMQATVEARGDAGTLTQNADGSYTYTFATDITNPNQTMGVTYDPSLTHRVAIQVEFEGATGEEIVQNPWFDFVPDGSPVTTTKLVTHVDSCNECHHDLALHGGGRIETEYCVVCHNPGTTDANSGNNLNFVSMIHKIHMGEDLGSPYTIWGFRDSEHDYSTVVYPQDHRNCAKCHTAEDPATPDGDNWKLRPTMEACGSCHDDVDFNNHPEAGIVLEDNTLCRQCHVPFSSSIYFAVENAHTDPIQELAKEFQYNIQNVSYNSASREVTVDFSVTDPTNSNAAYDIQNDPEFTAGSGASRMAILVGWNTDDFKNTGSGSDPAQPISINPLFGGSTDIGGKVFRVTTTLPAEASGTGVVAIEGHPAVDGNRVPVTNAFEYFSIDGQAVKPRRQIVALSKCNECHGNLSLHGGNRQGAIEVCTICHNPNATDIEVRPATLDENDDGVPDDFTATGVDGKREESIHFKYMIHAIHAGDADEEGFRENGIVVYGFGRSVHDYSEVGYPGELQACDACHTGSSFQVNAQAGSLATTIQTASGDLDGNPAAIEQALADPSDDINISVEATSCYSCHDQADPIDHMLFVGGAGVGTEEFLESSVFEDCGGCHGPNEFKDVADVHWMINP